MDKMKSLRTQDSLLSTQDSLLSTEQRGMVSMVAHRSPKPRVWVQILVPLPMTASWMGQAQEGRLN
jgi:hypothetical protein